MERKRKWEGTLGPNSLLHIKPKQSNMASSSSSTPSPQPRKKFDVFISFRGEDTRFNFTSHLREALRSKQIETYIDYRLEKGDEVWPSLEKAIEDSTLFLVIFSENYASSTWCLKELAKILECCKNKCHLVIPVFYRVDPSHVRKQSGSYQKAFEEHMLKSINKQQLQKWREDLTHAANLSGWDCSFNRDEAELIKEIVGCVIQRLGCMYQSEDFLKGLVGIHKRMTDLELLLDKSSNNVQFIGIWGMGGIGKTTLAEVLFHKLRFAYEGFCFVSCVREESRKHGIDAMREKLILKLLGDTKSHTGMLDSVSPFALSRLGRKKVFIVLDDVDDHGQLENLARRHEFGSGSKILITTRDKQVLGKEMDDIYQLKALNPHEAFNLFSINAFRNDHADPKVRELAEKVTQYANGNPLALKVLGSFLYGKDQEEWKSELGKLQKFPFPKINVILKLSLEGLDYEEKNIFLYIACFFSYYDVQEVNNLLDACGYSTKIGLKGLEDKSLLDIHGRRICMHPLLKEMCIQIVREESLNDPKRCNILWISKKISEILKKNKGSEAVEGIILNLLEVDEMCLSSEAFCSMPNLKFLCVYKNLNDLVGNELKFGRMTLPIISEKSPLTREQEELTMKQSEGELTMKQSDVASSSSSATSSQFPKKYDVFISFKGEDTRLIFTSHLHEALRSKQIETYIDYRLEKGDEVWPSLEKAIEDSTLFLVIFSENYASSTWCLKELAKILDCSKNEGHLVIPVFYGVEPSHIRKQFGSYQKAFEEHEHKGIDKQQLQNWRDAFTHAANLVGWHCGVDRNEAELITKITKCVVQKLDNKYWSEDYLKDLIGIHRKMADVESLLYKGSNDDVRFIGIWGMGGVGKTTLAKALFDKFHSAYEGSCFLSSVREKSKKYGIAALKKKLILELLGDKGSHIDVVDDTIPAKAIRRLSRKKIFIVLDDVDDHHEQLENLAGRHRWFGPGSKILVTTRDKQVFGKEADYIYKLETLNSDEAFQLFSLNAFKKGYGGDPKMRELAKKVTLYAGGNPLALKVLGSFLYGKSEEAWKIQLEKIQKLPFPIINDVIELSFEGLNNEEENIFLYIACFFNGCYIRDIVTLFDGCHYSTIIGLQRLEDKALLDIFEGKISMHHLIKEMGQQIVRKQSLNGPHGLRRRWWLRDCKALTSNTHLKSLSQLALEGCSRLNKFSKTSENCFLKLNLSGTAINDELCSSSGRSSKIGSLSLDRRVSVTSLNNMVDLRTLTVLHADCCNKLASNLRSLFNKIRTLEILRLTDCNELVEVPENISLLSSLAVLDLSRTSIETLPSSIKYLSSLRYLCLDECKRLCFLPEPPPYISKLSAQNCPSLKTLHLSHIHNYDVPKVNFMFTNCMKLDGQSIKAVETKVLLDINKAIYEDIIMEYPGKSVPKWFMYGWSMYRSTQCLETVDLCSIPEPWDGSFIFCVVISESSPNDEWPVETRVDVNWFIDGQNACKARSCFNISDSMLSDHIILWYDRDSYGDVQRKIEEKKRDGERNTYHPLLQIQFTVYCPKEYGRVRDIKECGVCPTSALECSNYIQQIHLVSNSHPNSIATMEEQTSKAQISQLISMN